MAPDGTFSTTIPNNWFTTYLQRRGGLNISVAHTAACEVAQGVDAVGD